MVLPFARRVLVALCLLLILWPVLAQEETPTPAAPPAIALPPSTPGESGPAPTPPGEEGPQTPPQIGPSTPQPPRPETPEVTPPVSLPAPTLGRTTVSISSQRQLFSPSLGLYQFFGEVTLQTRQILIRANELTYNDRTRSALARGNVSIRAEDGNTYWGNVLEYNVSTDQWRFLDFSVEFPAGFLGPPFIAPVIVNGEELSGLPHGARASNAHVTTCDLSVPHYEIVSRRVDIYPGDKLIARDNDFYLLGHRVLHLPWFFLSLKQNRTPIVPEFGQNDFEGYYGRFLYQYVFNPDQLGGIRLDLTQKRGVGLGVDHFYTIPGGTGEAFAYGREGLDEYVLRVDHAQRLPGQIDSTLRLDTRQNSFFTSQPTTVTDVTSRLSRNTAHTATTFNLTRRLNEGTYATDNVTANLQYTSSVAAGNLRNSFEYSSFGRTSSTGTTPADKELWSRLQWTRPIGFANLNLRIDQRTDVDGDEYTGDQSFSGVQRLPELYLESTQDDLGLTFLKSIPSRFTLGWGVFDEMPSDMNLNRYRFEWQSQTRVPDGSTTFSGSTSFRQTVYGDPDTTAQYMYNANITANTKVGALNNVLRYSRQNSRGYTPFRFDVIYPYENVTNSLQYLTPNLRMYFTGGKDIERDRWQDLTFRSVARLAEHVTTNQSLGYDLNTGNWRDLVSQYSWQNDPLLTFNLSSRYDLEKKRLRRISTEMEWVATPKWRIQWLGGYDGVTHDFLYNEFLITRDLHCWDASLYYSEEQHYTYLYIRLKALNLPLPRFGIGRGGEVLDTNQGIAQ